MKKEIKKRYQVNIKLSYDKDKDLIDILERVKKQTFIKTALREYLSLKLYGDH